MTRSTESSSSPTSHRPSPNHPKTRNAAVIRPPQILLLLLLLICSTVRRSPCTIVTAEVGLISLSELFVGFKSVQKRRMYLYLDFVVSSRLVIFGHRRPHPTFLHQYSCYRRRTAKPRISPRSPLHREAVPSLVPPISTHRLNSIKYSYWSDLRYGRRHQHHQESSSNSPYLPPRPRITLLPPVPPPYGSIVRIYLIIFHLAN